MADGERGLSEDDVRFRVTKENVKAKTVPVHVLVVVPPEEKTSSPYAVIAATLFQHTFLNVPSTTASRTQKLKKQLVKKYKCDCGINQNGDSMLLCMVMNVALPSSVVIASHIFRREHDHLKGHFVQIADIDDVDPTAMGRAWMWIPTNTLEDKYESNLCSKCAAVQCAHNIWQVGWQDTSVSKRINTTSFQALFVPSSAVRQDKGDYPGMGAGRI
ncbi:hypothetical protein PC113_g23057 [Phytophthora cactorum]|uniref:Uncharacterized protein n=2 Tax=Phytophthora cactorum TaxID=29920 RepID=A0A8T0XVQ2_9STRA|nr:hypothetical protein PC111_g22750 [Phytophthora cactorum]KAG2816711.1 hypothetical protein PC113_g23057 [Phytophthora cactorum]